MATKHSSFSIAAFFAGALSLSAVDLSTELASGSIWDKNRQEICSSDFVGLRYMPIDDHAIRLCPRLTVNEGCGSQGKGLGGKSKLTIGNLEFGETIVRWDNDMQTKSMLGLIYNRGDDGEISKAEYSTLIRKSIVALDKMTNSVGYVRETKGKGDEDHVGLPGLRHWYWEWAGGVLLLEASASDMGKDGIRPEFIRLKMGPHPEAIATGGAENFTNAAWLKKNVKKDGSKVFIAGVPMVDQGQKGYCLVATVARVFAYYGADAVDQHALAQICDTDPEDGTSCSVMHEELCDMGRKFNFTVLPLYADKSDLLKLTKHYINNGVPLLWLIPEHMRLIIGYNSATNEVYYTDSWGHGHEMGTMTLGEAQRIHEGFYIMIPNK